MIEESILAELQLIVGTGGIRVGDALGVIHPGSDERNLDAGLMVAPRSTAEVAAVLRLCNEHKIPVVTHGGRTGLVGGGISASGQIILSLSLMNSIEALSASAGTAIVQGGVTLHALQEAAAHHRLSTGIDIASRGSATIGGMISTNAGGMEAFRHGIMRQRVLGLEVVLSDGRIMSDMAQVSKSNEGYDLKQLFIGAEGTLGVITRAVLKLAPPDGFTATALVACPSATAAIALFHRLQASHNLHLLRAEFMANEYFMVAVDNLGPATLTAITKAPIYLIIETDAAEQSAAQSILESALAKAIDEGLVLDAILAQSEKERREIWNIREDSSVIDRAYPQGHWFDISVPLQHLEHWLKQFDEGITALGPDVYGFAFGHLGDGNLHVGVAGIPDKQAVKSLIYSGLREFGGSFSAEHGIGLDKKAELETLVDPVKLNLMRSIKSLLDPNGIMNPGKVV
ncbi:FAD-binding oxidoreductase [Phyllobacterium sp. YR531]|uniref:FAD-binding oxidoreductase n=1 Tax=Phyllobacterium sp. YR531 TaxID=1144343 RepID=UPI00026F8FE6|nr:FAD-binding oxidoreductase [Phyllobacterium sp. YR531]EJN03611.1 FAD/FMN-dependent dehydrogenase [Phyllobacterium sp. YR531]